MKRTAVILILLCAGILCNAQNSRDFRRISYGLEWGAELNFFNRHKVNYMSEKTGSRVDDDVKSFQAHTCGSVLGSVGVNVSRHFNESILAGYSGMSKDTRMIPVTIRSSWYPKAVNMDGMFAFLEGGADMKRLSNANRTIIGKFGTGYRHALSSRTRVDFIFSLERINTRPRIWDRYSNSYVSQKNIRYNRAEYLFADFSISLNF